MSDSRIYVRRRGPIMLSASNQLPDCRGTLLQVLAGDGWPRCSGDRDGERRQIAELAKGTVGGLALWADNPQSHSINNR
jgi:hypothetical protein